MPVRYSVMISSTYEELRYHRAAVKDAVHAAGMYAIVMETDSARPDKDLIDASFEKVDEANAYVGLISYRYGQTPACSRRNRQRLSLTELEFRRAKKRGLPICMFIMHENLDVSHMAVGGENAEAHLKLAAFTALAKKGRIYDEFESPDDLKTKTTRSLVSLQKMLDKAHAAKPAVPTVAAPRSHSFFAKPQFIPGAKFQGRAKELAAIRDWARGPEPVMLLEAIGGMGKSMIAWEWIKQHAAKDRKDWAGRLWYSFYEHGATMRDFCVDALAYMTRTPPEAFANQPSYRLADALIGQLQEKRWLLALDGLERVLVAYHRHDAAQVNDEEASVALDAEADATDCIHPDDGELLKRLVAAAPSKILATSRLMPNSWLGDAGQPRPGVRRWPLVGLDAPDAEAMLREASVTGDSYKMRDFLERKFGCHPIYVGMAAGLVRKHVRALGDFDVWVEAEDGGAALDLRNPDIKSRKTHILKQAFDGLAPLPLTLIARLAIVSNAVDIETLEALNPAPPHGPKLSEMVSDLERRGLLQVDRLRREFDLHPVVRGYAVQSLSSEARAENAQCVADYFASRASTPDEKAASLAELRNRVQVAQALALAGKLEKLWEVLDCGLLDALNRLDVHHEALALLRPLFPSGWLAPPVAIEATEFVAAGASLTLGSLKRNKEAIRQRTYSLQSQVRNGLTSDLAIHLRALSAYLHKVDRKAESERLVSLSLEVDEAASLRFAIWAHLLKMMFRIEAGGLPEAEAGWREIAPRLPNETQFDEQLEAQAALAHVHLLWRTDKLTESDLGGAIELTCRLRERVFERRLRGVRGEWLQARGDDTGAVEAFGRAIEMAREAGLSDTDPEARRGLSLLRLGRRSEAEAAAAAAERDPPHDALAEFYFELGEPTKARDHALAGYSKFWCDGPPYADHWHLQACRAILARLGVPAPALSPYDPAKYTPFAFETDIRRLLEGRRASR